MFGHFFGVILMSMNSNLKGSIYLFLGALIWGSALIAQSSGMDYVSPFTYSACRFFIACLVLLPYLFKKCDKEIRRNSMIGGLVCGFVLFFGNTLQQYGLITTSPGKAGFISSLYLIFVPIVSFFLFKKKVGKQIWLCVALAILGFYFLCINGVGYLQLGDLLMLLCAFMFAIQILSVDHYTNQKVDPIILSFYQSLSCGFVSLICMFLFDTIDLHFIYEARWTILYAGVISSGLGYTFQVLGQKGTDPTIASLIMSLESVFSVLFEWLLLHHSMNLTQLFGCLLVFIAVIFVQIPSKEKENAR